MKDKVCRTWHGCVCRHCHRRLQQYVRPHKATEAGARAEDMVRCSGSSWSYVSGLPAVFLEMSHLSERADVCTELCRMSGIVISASRELYNSLHYL